MENFCPCGLYQLLALCRSQNTVRALKSRNLWFAEYVSQMGDVRYICRNLESDRLDIKTVPWEAEFEMNETA
jgi:hypothetical protein